MIRKASISLCLSIGLLSGCLSHMREAKLYYYQGQEYSRAYRSEQAIAAYKRAHLEAEQVTRRRPSAQAYLLKGLTEVQLELWSAAGESFRRAFALGFASGEDWAADLSLLGLAVSFEERGLREAALRSYEHLVERSEFRPVLLAASERFVDLLLRGLGNSGENEKAKRLAGAEKIVDRLLGKDYSCGFYHYLFSQILSHKVDYRRSYEEAIMAKELGLPSEMILRDNDNQILFCHDKLLEGLSPSERESFAAIHAGWAARWGWKDERTPAWKKD